MPHDHDDVAATFARDHDLHDSVRQALSKLLRKIEADDGTEPPKRRTRPKRKALPEPDPGAKDRYEDLGVIGQGGMGEVRRVRDKDLGRICAMKIIHAKFLVNEEFVARFIEEAQATAQLAHPGIVPVLELGRLGDGRLYFTMEEVRGDTFGTVIKALHHASGPQGWGSIEGWTFRRAIDAFHTVCEAVAYAHARGVIHRDIKPSNIMVGAFGEVQVMDWGLAKVIDRHGTAEEGQLGPVSTARSEDLTRATLVGTVAGTPWFMAPEQARGQVHRLGPPADVYALGAVLYSLLSGRPPYEGKVGSEVLEQVKNEPCIPLSTRTTPPLPEGLVEICERAMRRDDQQRYPTAQGLAQAVAAWLDGERRLQQAQSVVERASGLGPRVEAWKAKASALRHEADSMLADVEPWRPAEDKEAAWALMDRAEELERDIAREKLEVTQTLHAALTIAPDLASAHALLAERYREEHELAEQQRDAKDSARAEANLRVHARALPETHPARQAHLEYLRGDGRLTLMTDPPAASVKLYSFDREARHLVPMFLRELGETPLLDVSLPMGSYLCEIARDGRPTVRYPFALGRQERHDAVPPGGLDSHRVHLPARLAEDECYVPAGWFWSGGDDEALDPLPRRRLWSDGFVMQRDPVTNRQYIAFLDDLVARGEDEVALKLAPREMGKDDEAGMLIYGFGGDGFELVPDKDGDVWELDWPVFNIDAEGALAYASWRSAQDGWPWRLPVELEWEKAARGVDGRFFPWGDVLDPSWCCMRDSHAQRPLPSAIDGFPADLSPYGVRGLGGNVRDLCADAFLKEGPPMERRVLVVQPSTGDRLVARGGRWSGHARSARACSRSGVAPTARLSNLGFRLARSVP